MKKIISTKLAVYALIALFLCSWIWLQWPVWTAWMNPNIPYREVLLFEPRFTAEQIIQSQSGQALFSETNDLQEPRLELHPYLLMEVKYLKNNQSLEATVLWSLTQAEILLDSNRWQMTHGYYDCLLHGANAQEMTIVNALAQHGGNLDREALLRLIHRSDEQLDKWLHQCMKKQLVVQLGNTYRLHLQNPKLAHEPKSLLSSPLRKKNLGFAKVIIPKYRPQALIDLSHAAFGPGFSVRRQSMVYLPVYTIQVNFADGSTTTSKWNAHTGRILEIPD